jgi:hypothetical protein
LAEHSLLGRLINEVIGKKTARSFLLERSHSRNPTILALFDHRVIHLLSKGYSDKENPGVRYNIYTLDYGTYVDLIQTKKQPDLGLIETDEPDRLVPFDDKRSIRRIVLDLRNHRLIAGIEPLELSGLQCPDITYLIGSAIDQPRDV